MNRVYVMCSTYNGQAYLRRQLDSILSQEGVEIQLYIRDDGSTDDTGVILREYARKCDNIHVIEGDNIGYIRSFLWLVFHVPAEPGAYYSFSDQDDVWHSSKLVSAIDMIREEEGNKNLPVLYYSDLNVVDEKEHFIRKANSWEGTIDRYKIAMFIGVRGCTMVFNSALQCKLFQHEPQQVSSHDTYVAMVAFWLGRVVYDEHAYINYRQTGGNVSITGVSKWDKFKKNLQYVKKRLTTRANIHAMNAKEVCEGYGEELDTPCELLEIVRYKDSLKSRFNLIFNRKWNRFSLPIRCFNALFVLLGKL